MGDDGCHDHEDCERDLTFLEGTDFDNYMARKGVLYIERIKDIVGEVMSIAKTLNYDMIEYIMRNVVYNKKVLRESFFQEILNASSYSSMTQALEKYINDN